jgi:phospholipid-binding lipoprotein MlaA
MPVFGPRTERHAYGTVVDIALNPRGSSCPPTAERRGGAVQLVETRYSLGPGIDGVLYDSADSYALSRSIYLQNRRFFLAEGQSDGLPSTRTTTFRGLR